MFKLDSESTDLTNNIFPSCLTFKIPSLPWNEAELSLNCGTLWLITSVVSLESK